MGVKKSAIFCSQFYGYTYNNFDITNLLSRRFLIKMKGGLKK